MQPEQLRAARAALNWSLERLAEASGVHRNTLSNFETRKYAGDPDKLAIVRKTLEEAGVIFVEENREAGVGLRRFEPGDRVRFRPQTRVRFDFGIAAEETGTVTGVEPHPPQTGPTYRIEVQFGRVRVPYVFRYEYELVKPASVAVESSALDHANAPTVQDTVAIIEAFCVICTSARNDYDLYRSLFESDHRVLDLYTSVAPLCFRDLSRILKENLYIQFCKITDPSKSRKKSNLTSIYLLDEIPWPDEVRQKLREVNDRLQAFRAHIEPARSKRIAHVDLSAQVERWSNLGGFPEGAEIRFLQDLQTFINIAYGHFHSGSHRPIAVAMSTDSHQLIRALEKSVIFDRCPKCDEGQRASAILDYENSPT